MTPASVNQKGASAQGDIIGGDKYEFRSYYAASTNNVVDILLERLRAEMEQNETVRHVIEELQRYHIQRNPDGVAGLEKKLAAGGRAGEYLDAIEKKEMFAKILEK